MTRLDTAHYDFLAAITDRLAGLHDLLDARLPKPDPDVTPCTREEFWGDEDETTPQRGATGAQAAREGDQGSQEGDAEKGAQIDAEPPVGSQVTDDDTDVWRRFSDGWHWWSPSGTCWSSTSRDFTRLKDHHGPLTPMTDADRVRVGLPTRASDEVVVKRADLEAILNDGPRQENIDRLRDALEQGR